MSDDILAELLRYRSEIVAFAYSICGDDHLSDDVAQETILTVMRKYREIDELRNPQAWMREIARRETRYQLRRRRHNGREWCVAELEDVIDRAFVEEQEEADTDREQKALAKCLENVTERIRSMLISRLVDGADYDQIAAEHKLKQDATRQIISRTRRKLMGCVERRMRLNEAGHA